MRIITADQFEFPSGSEEFVEIAIARRGGFPFPDLESFVRARMGGEAFERLGQSAAFGVGPSFETVRDYIRDFAHFNIPSDCGWPTYFVERPGEDWEFELVISGPECFIHYSWGSSA